MAQYELNVIDYWLILKKRKYLILLSTILVVVFTVLFSEFLRPDPLYEASARVKFERSTTIAQQLLESLSYSSMNDLGTQIEFIRSFPVIERVAVDLGRVDSNTSPEEQKSATYLNIIYNLGQEITAQREGDTNIIRISATSDEPELAERMANSAASAYRVENIAARNRLVTDSKRFVEEQLASLEKQLNDSEDALRTFKENEGRVFLADEARAALDTFTKLEEQYNDVLRKRTEGERQIEVLKHSDAVIGNQTGRIFTEEQNALLTILNQRLLDLIQERDTLLINYTPDHPQVVEQQMKVDNVKSEMIQELKSKVATLMDREEALQEQRRHYRQRYLGYPRAAIQMSRLEREVKVNTDLLATLKAKHQELLIKGAERIEEVSIIAPAITPSTPINGSNITMNLMIGGLMGCFLGIVLAFGRESFDTSIGTIEGVEEFLKVPVLGIIPQLDHKVLKEMALETLPPDTPPSAAESLSKLICLLDPKSVLSESLRSLRTNIQFASLDRRVKSIIFTSAALGEGKSTCVINLAITMAQEGIRVLLVDADLRKPIVHQRLGIEREPGLVDALLGTTSWRSYVRSATDLMLGTVGVDRFLSTPGLDNLHVITSGSESGNPNEFLNITKIKALIAEMQEDYDIVLIDTPPILPVTDAVAFSSRVDGTILVYQVGRIGRNALKRAKFLLDHAQANVLGVVLTNVKSEVTPEYGLYRYEYR
ncbi:MAG: polysaccharide biosynthesis tyrosine autokinase [Nitrospira sp.]|jgi:succinoglycan biosynthesis transport protein ExoP|nr:polysaccharide biosynthesis tyrosine autokinase [Nitrospira sp.]MDH4242938.1 polysaccharide biosynthesis tyrosine autokinase [Nitrospira sp.]MDH4355930.1 polysaccharide biosynthesis tyrosine autokinase [Nitrospira sp.]MDH5318570.1 polysaccharide biosynthesis tyrosine autokinase [Nitrospira sp.]